MGRIGRPVFVSPRRISSPTDSLSLRHRPAAQAGVTGASSTQPPLLRTKEAPGHRLELRRQNPEPFSSCFRPNPNVIAGQNGEKAAAAPTPLPQNRTRYPLLYRPVAIVGRKCLYSPRMTRNNENTSAKCVAKQDKVPQPGPCCWVTHADDPRSISPQPGTGRRNPSSPGRILWRPRLAFPQTGQGLGAAACPFALQTPLVHSLKMSAAVEAVRERSNQRSS
jgi:hypothetical protein